MKRFLSLLLTFSLAACLFPVQAKAAGGEAQEAAERLYELGLFGGTGTDANGQPAFDLELVPTRQQAITMLVRMLGKESEALAGTWTTPFTDVADWAKPYVGYAYTNKLTGGTGDTTYGGEDPISASQYITFILRVLGYSSDSDFAWDRAWELSDKLGFTDGRYQKSGADFTRGDMVIISASALDTKLKDGGGTLLATLQKSGAVAGEPEPEEEEVVVTFSGNLTDGIPTGNLKNIPHSTLNQLADGKTASVSSYTAQTLDNGYTRFRVKYELSEAMNIQVFDSRHFLLTASREDTTAVGTLVFDLKDEDLRAVSRISVKFYTDDSGMESFYASFETEDIDRGITLTDGTPTGEAKELVYTIRSEPADGSFGSISGYTAQTLNNGYTRFTVKYEFSERMNIAIIDPPAGEHISLRWKTEDTGAGTLVFDLKNWVLQAVSEVTLQFYNYDNKDNKGSCWAFLRTADINRGITTTGGTPTGGPKEVVYITRNQLADGKSGSISSYTAQPLDNGYTRFTVEYEFPEAMGIDVFDPPNGNRFLLTSDSADTGTGTFVFDLKDEDLRAVSEVTLSFYKGLVTGGDCYFVFFRTAQL